MCIIKLKNLEKMSSKSFVSLENFLRKNPLQQRKSVLISVTLISNW